MFARMIRPLCRPARRFYIFLIEADIAYMGESKGDKLTGKRGVGEAFLIAGHRRV